MKPKDVDNRNNKDEVEGLASCHQVGPVTQAESLQRKIFFHFLRKLFTKKICFFCQHIQQIHGTLQDTIIDSLPTLSACGITLLLLALKNGNGYREVKCH